MATSKEVCDALEKKYAGEEWVTIQEARCGAGFKGLDGSADFIAINTWPSRGFAIHGYEVKISRSDWLRELKKPDKAERFWKYCNQWSLIVPAPYTMFVYEGELPVGWGLFELNDKGKIRQIVGSAVKKEATPLPWDWSVGWLAQLDRKQSRAGKGEVDRAVAEAIVRVREQYDKEYEQRNRSLIARTESLEAFTSSLGINKYEAGNAELTKEFQEFRDWRVQSRDRRMTKREVDAVIKALTRFKEDEL